MSQVRLLDEYTARRLESWGEAFAFHRDVEILGHCSRNLLQVLIDHKGEMPARSIGFKPLLIPPVELQTEDAVALVHSWDPDLAYVLRAYYCGSGRRRVERRELAEQLTGRSLKVSQFYALHDCGFQRVAGILSTLAVER